MWESQRRSAPHAGDETKGLLSNYCGKEDGTEPVSQGQGAVTPGSTDDPTPKHGILIREMSAPASFSSHRMSELLFPGMTLGHRTTSKQEGQ